MLVRAVVWWCDGARGAWAQWCMRARARLRAVVCAMVHACCDAVVHAVVPVVVRALHACGAVRAAPCMRCHVRSVHAVVRGRACGRAGVRTGVRVHGRTGAQALR